MQNIDLKPSEYADCMYAAKVKTPKYKFHVEIGGLDNAQTILLITGVGAQHLAWPTPFCQALIDGGYRVIRFDNRDIGKSSKMKHKNKLTKHYTQPVKQLLLASRFHVGLSNRHLPLPYDLYDMAEDVRQLMQALDIQSCYFIGMSMGGMIAQILAAKDPERVIKLGLIATSNNRPFSMPPSPRRVMQALSQPKNKKDAELVTQHIYKTLKAVSSSAFFDEKRAHKKAQMLYQRRFYPKGTRRHILAVLATGSLKKLNHCIKQPTLIIHGSKDKIIPPAHGRNVAKQIKQSKFISIPEMGHEIPVDIAEKIAHYFLAHFEHSAANQFE